MQNSNEPGKEPIKPDLKHDNMEYSAATDGDDILDTDLETKQDVEDEEISAAELDLLTEDEIDNQAEALNTAETDSLADEDNFLVEDQSDIEETYDQPGQEDEPVR